MVKAMEVTIGLGSVKHWCVLWLWSFVKSGKMTLMMSPGLSHLRIGDDKYITESLRYKVGTWILKYNMWMSNRQR